MKQPLKLIALLSILALPSCKTFEASSVATWWAKPSTQAGVKIAEQYAQRAALNFLENLAIQEVTGEKVDVAALAMTSIGTSVRQLELTPEAGDAPAIIAAVKTAVTDKATARQVAATIIASTAQAVAQGADASGALEGAVRGLEQAAKAAK